MSYIQLNTKTGSPISAGYLPNPVTPKTKEMSVFSVVAFYWLTSLSVVFLNKTILTSINFGYPLFVTLYQLIVAFAFIIVGHRFPALGITPVVFDLSVARKIAPLTLIYVGMLSFNNLCLQYVPVTFYQVARSLSILFNIVFTKILLKQSTSNYAILACGIVFFGFVLGSAGEVEFSWLGIVFGVSSSVFVALYGIYVKKALVYVDNDEWSLLYYNTLMSIAVLGMVCVVSGEAFGIFGELVTLKSIPFWFIMTLTGVTGFLINVAIFLQIKVTTPLTNTISGTAKACVQTLLAASIYQNPISLLNGIGIFFALFGSGFYSWVRYKKW